jgi:hypothetical protein
MRNLRRGMTPIIENLVNYTTFPQYLKIRPPTIRQKNGPHFLAQRESNVTWNNKPCYGGGYGSKSIVWGWYNFDVTNLVCDA